MNIKELDSYHIEDAINFHEDLNPQLWINDTMRKEVRSTLKEISDDFLIFLGIKNIAVIDIRVSGSNAAYSYTPYSDIDLHIIIDFDQISNDSVYKELFDAKKYQYNDVHDIEIRGYDVELYVQDSKQHHESLGEYSIVQNDWVRIPSKRRANLNDTATHAKYHKLRDLILLAISNDDLSSIEQTTDIIRKYRNAGLTREGEFSPENLVFKILRRKGYIEKLWNKRQELEDKKLSL
jgi:hypothetical protein